MSDWYSHNEICADIKSFEQEVIDIIRPVIYNIGEYYTDDLLQDVYLECCDVFLNAFVHFDEFKKQVKAIAERLAFEMYYKLKRNPAKPIKQISARGSENSSGNEWNNMGDAFQWAIIEDYSGNPQKRFEVLEAIAELKQYKGKWLTFENAKEVVQSYCLKSKKDWVTHCGNGLLKNIPSNPDEVYNKKWISWNDWLGVKFFTYEECKAYVRSNLNLKDESEWSGVASSLPRSVPYNPETEYKNEWKGWDVFLGLYQQKKWDKMYMPYKEALHWVTNNICIFQLTGSTWMQYAKGELSGMPKLPINIPINPDIVYQNTGWVNWYTWLGSGKYNSRLYKFSYHSCFVWVRENIPLINTEEKWKDFVDGKYAVKKPDFIPAHPDKVYRNIGWHGWGSFLRNWSAAKQVDNVFDAAVRINYKGNKLWVQPLNRIGETVSAKVITLFSPIKANSIIEFNINDMIQIKQDCKPKTKSWF